MMLPFRRLLVLLLLLQASGVAIASHAVVFMYHRFGESRYPSTNVQLEQFEAHLDWLAHNGFTVWPLERIVRHLQDGTPIPDKTVALTVDDAYLSVYTEAWPRLRARGWPLTVFVGTEAVDRQLPDFMSWQQMRQMQQSGARFANHGTRHDSLAMHHRRGDDPARLAQMRADIEHAQQRLQQELGPDTNTQPPLYAYPYGEYDEIAANLVQQLGYVAFGQQSGPIGPLSDRRALPRYPMNVHYAHMDSFTRKALSLPLPVQSTHPWNPIGHLNPPRLEMVLATPMASLACYTQDGDAIPLQAVGDHRYRVQATRPLPPGRARYNCTAPAGEGRWYWYSHAWLITASPPATAGQQSDPDR